MKKVLASKEQSLAKGESLLSQSQQEIRDKQTLISQTRDQNEAQKQQLLAAEKE